MSRAGLDLGAADMDGGASLAPRTLAIASEHDRFWASGEARRFAAAAGLDAGDQARIALVVAELASNAAKYAGRGRIELAEIVTPSRGLRVRADDDGPGIAQLAEAMSDGFSEGRLLTPDVPLGERRGLGIGLGTVCRLMSEVRVLPRPGSGLRIEAVLWRRSEQASGSEEEVQTWRSR